MRKRKKNFSLLEVLICIAILGLVASLLSWQIKDMVAAHQFHKSIDQFLTDLRKIQMLALADRCDIEMKISQDNGEYSYIFTSDEVLPLVKSQKNKLTGVKKITLGKLLVKKETTLSVYSSGRIEPQAQVQFFQKEDQEKGIVLDLTIPLCIELKKEKIYEKF